MGGKWAKRRSMERRSLRNGYRVTARYREPETPQGTYRSLTHFLMGDPPIGRSALDMKIRKDFYARWPS